MEHYIVNSSTAFGKGITETEALIKYMSQNRAKEAKHVNVYVAKSDDYEVYPTRVVGDVEKRQTYTIDTDKVEDVKESRIETEIKIEQAIITEQ